MSVASRRCILVARCNGSCSEPKADVSNRHVSAIGSRRCMAQRGIERLRCVAPLLYRGATRNRQRKRGKSIHGVSPSGDCRVPHTVSLPASCRGLHPDSNSMTGIASAGGGLDR